MLKLSESVAETRTEARRVSAVQDSEPLLIVDRVSKRYEIYERPQDRLKQSLVPRFQTLLPVGMRRSHPFFKEFWALREISLTVDRGEALGILGRNGAGKSTLLQIIAGTLAPTSGEVIARGKVAALLELGSGFSPDFTGRENVRLNASLLGLSSAEIDLRFADIAAFADIGDFMEHPVKTYSSGMMMRLAFAVQTAVEPELLIIDEALSVGDARFQKKCFARLEQLRRHGTTILFVTHDTGAVLQFCSRAIVLDGGRIVAEGAPAPVARRYHQLLFGNDTVTDNTQLLSAAENSRPGEGKATPPASTPDSTTRSGEERTDTTLVGAAREVGDPKHCASLSEVRYGSRAAEIVDIGIRDVAGLETRIVEIHGTYEFHFKVRFNSDVENPLAYGFIISNRRGIEIFATKAGLYGKALPPAPSGTIYECFFRAAVPIVGGTYFLSVAVAHDDGPQEGQFLDFRFDALQFEIVGSHKAFATCMLDVPGELAHRQPPPVLNAAADDDVRA